MALNSKYRKLWKAAGYERGHGSDAVMPPPDKGLKRLYYLTSADHGLSNIVLSRIKVSRFSELNDPFELLGQNFGAKKIRELVREHKEEFNRSRGLLCLSEDWTDPVLWSHYASKHKGIALGFDVPDSIAKEVKYSAKRLNMKVPAGTKSIAGELVELLVCTKFDSWSYEREWRILVDLSRSEKEGGLYFHPMGKNLRLAEVILGAACTMDLKRIRALVRSHHPDAITYSARLAYRSFRVIPRGKSVPERVAQIA